VHAEHEQVGALRDGVSDPLLRHCHPGGGLRLDPGVDPRQPALVGGGRALRDRVHGPVRADAARQVVRRQLALSIASCHFARGGLLDSALLYLRKLQVAEQSRSAQGSVRQHQLLLRHAARLLPSGLHQPEGTLGKLWNSLAEGKQRLQDVQGARVQTQEQRRIRDQSGRQPQRSQGA